jgi:hypothetical protein
MPSAGAAGNLNLDQSLEVSSILDRRKLRGVKREVQFRICKIECHPPARYSIPGEGATVVGSIANYIIIWNEEEERKKVLWDIPTFLLSIDQPYPSISVKHSSMTLRHQFCVAGLVVLLNL